MTNAAASFGKAFSIAGAVIVVTTTMIASLASPAAILFTLWALLPYVLLWFSPRVIRNPWAIGGAGATAVIVEAAIRVAVFVFPQGSTAAIALVFSPAWIALIGMPAGALTGALFGRLFTRAPRGVRALLAVAAGTAMALVFLAFARPDLLPWAIAARQASLAEIGDPRVISGGERFARTVVSDRSGWHDASNVDGKPGDEIIVADHAGAEIFDPGDLASRVRVTFGGERGRLWNWYSRLRQFDGLWVVVQTGGGYQATEVRSLENALLWKYQPDEKLPPSALLPADLDADGRTELYASTTHHLARLDEQGREVWSRPASVADIVVVEPPSHLAPGWIVASEYEEKVHILGHDGNTLAELAWPDGPIIGVLEWEGARLLIVNLTRPVAIAPDGQARLEIPLSGGMTLQQAVAVRWTKDADPVLATVSVAARDVKRWRIELRDRSGNVIYSEVTGQPQRLIVATDAAGHARLLISGAALSALQPVAP